jgi:hypothetical protein
VQPITVRVIHMAECPATPGTVQLVESIARSMGTSIALERLLVKTPEEAEALAFLGSPTVQVGGRDIEPEARSRTDFGLT